MSIRVPLTLVSMAVVALLMTSLPNHSPLRADEKSAPSNGRAWTLDEALQQLRLYPRDPYLQYVALQLARRENRGNEVASQIHGLTVGDFGPGGNERVGGVDLFSLFSGALAVQESLQLDTMRGEPTRRLPPRRINKDDEAPATAKGDPWRGSDRFKQLGLALHGYHDTFNCLPTAVSFDKAGKRTGLSWRVHILPYLEQDLLYRRFKLDEPWDSDHNQKLIAQMPAIFRPENPKLATAGKTHVVAPLGDEVFFPKSNKRVGFAQITDGLSNTIMVVEADDENAVVWTKPDDLEIDLKKPHKGLAIRPPGAFLALMGDGSIKLLRKSIDPKTLKALFTPNGGEVFSLDPRDEVTEVSASTLAGPTIKSHPWQKMLAGRKPDVGRLSRCVPEDFYLIEFRSLVKMLEVMDQSDLWGTHLFNQSVQEARTQLVGERLKKQLAIETTNLLRPFYDTVVGEVAVTGSDLYLREGSDVTMLFGMKQPEVFQARMNGFLASAEKAGARRAEGEYRGVPFVHLTTPDRSVHVYSAYPQPDLHVRSNSRVGFQRVIEAMQGKGVRRLGDTDEYAYIRTLMPRGAAEEDGLVYLSDPFIRRLVGPVLKLTELRRMQCYNHLRMIGHAALMYRTEHGKPAATLEELARAGCCPGEFGKGDLSCPEGGKYSLSADGLTAVCSHHGHAHSLTPCCEIPVKNVSLDEARAYREFLDSYNEYWRTFFDPIALRIQVTPKRYRMETIVLPLIDNSIYSGLSRVLGGKPEPLDALPVPKRNIFSVAARLDKRELLNSLGMPELIKAAKEDAKPSLQAPAPDTLRMVNRFKMCGLALHSYHDVNGQFPTAVSFDKAAKKTGLSWRVHILPYLEQDNLYKLFKLDEPWDSPNNKKLIALMPEVFRPENPKLVAAGKTRVVAPLGDEMIFPKSNTKVRITDIQDGTSNTIMLVEADDENAVVWTKPDDLEIDLKKPHKGLAIRPPGAFLVLMGDGSVQFLREKIAATTLSALFTRAGGEVVAVNDGDRVSLTFAGGLSVPEVFNSLKVGELLAKGIGNQIGLHVYDAEPMFDFSLPGALGLAMGSFGSQRLGRLGGEELLIVPIVTSLNTPIYVSLPVQDVKVVDEFLARLDGFLSPLARQKARFEGSLRIEQDFYQFGSAEAQSFRGYGFRFGPLKWRFYWGRIGNGLYLASKPYILEDLLAAEKDKAGGDAPAAHGMARVRPRNWDRVRKDYQLGWAENHREACLHNLGPLSSLSRSLGGKGSDAELRRLSAKLYGVQFFCPEEGRYLASPDGKAVTCSVHGSARAPRQPAVPAEKSSLGRLLREFDDMTLSLTFLEDGLHAVVTIDRK